MPQIDIATFWSIIQWSFFYFIMLSFIIYVVLLLPFLNLIKGKKKQKVLSYYVSILVILSNSLFTKLWD